jgi:uncharacterized coiled-coil DUF342 family protein
MYSVDNYDERLNKLADKHEAEVEMSFEAWNENKELIESLRDELHKDFEQIIYENKQLKKEVENLEDEIEELEEKIEELEE